MGLRTMINKIGTLIKPSSQTAMSEKQFLEQEIARWKRSPERKNAIIGEKYYQGEHDILNRKRTAIGPSGNLVEINNLPNNQIIDNQYARLVSQKCNYLVGKPLTFDSENKIYMDELKRVFNNRFQRLLRNVGEASLNGGKAWVYPYYGIDGKLNFTYFKSYEILPFWADVEHTELELAVRLYEVEVYEGTNRKTTEFVEIYRDTGIEYYRLINGALIPDENKSRTDYIIGNTDDKVSYNWEKIPLIPFKYNNGEQPLICRVKSLQDGINAILSDFENNMQEDCRNTVLILENYDGEELGEFRQNLSVYGVVKVKNEDGMRGGVTALEISVNSDNYKAILDIFKRALISNAMGYDAADLRSSGSPNQMNIKSVLNDLDMDTNQMETEYQASFEELLEFVNIYLYNAGIGDFFNENVEIIFNRDTIISESEVIEDIKNSVGILSDETLVAQHPYVKNAEAELEKLKKQKEADMQDYMNSFPMQTEKNDEE